MTNYSRGAYFERQCMKQLEAEGWTCFRSAGSHRCADVIALKAGEVRLIQCKVSKQISKVEREHLTEVARQNNVQAWLAYRDKGIKLERVY